MGDFMGFDTIPAKNISLYADASRYCIIDVRTPEEYAQGHIPGAYNIPYEDFDEYLMRLTHKRSYVFYCDHGATSLLIARKMFREGHDVKSIVGGMNAYRGQISYD